MLLPWVIKGAGVGKAPTLSLVPTMSPFLGKVTGTNMRRFFLKPRKIALAHHHSPLIFIEIIEGKNKVVELLFSGKLKRRTKLQAISFVLTRIRYSIKG